MIHYIFFTLFLIYSWWLFNAPPPQDQALHDKTHSLTQLTREQQSQLWLESLRQLSFPTSHKSKHSKLSKYITKREALLTKIRGHIDIGDLIHQRQLTPHLYQLISKMEEYDQNMSRLESAHTCTLASVAAMHHSFRITLEHLIHSADQAPTVRDRASKHRDHRRRLTTQLRSAKLFMSVAAKSIVHGLRVLAKDTVQQSTLAGHRGWSEIEAMRKNPLFAIVKGELDDSNDENALVHPCEVLTKLGLDASHPLHGTLVHDVMKLARWQGVIERGFLAIRHDLVEIDDCLHDLLKDVKNLDFENLRTKAVSVGRLIDKLGTFVVPVTPTG